MGQTRRQWTIEEKLAIVAAAKTSGDPVSAVARRYGMNANHLFNWLQRDRDGTLDRRALNEETGGLRIPTMPPTHSDMMPPGIPG